MHCTSGIVAHGACSGMEEVGTGLDADGSVSMRMRMQVSLRMRWIIRVLRRIRERMSTQRRGNIPLTQSRQCSGSLALYPLDSGCLLFPLLADPSDVRPGVPDVSKHLAASR